MNINNNQFRHHETSAFTPFLRSPQAQATSSLGYEHIFIETLADSFGQECKAFIDRKCKEMQSIEDEYKAMRLKKNRKAKSQKKLLEIANKTITKSKS